MVFSKLFDDAQRKKKETLSKKASSDASLQLKRKSPEPSDPIHPSVPHQQRHTPAAGVTAARIERPPRTNKRQRSSPQVLEFSAKLKDLSRQKKMDEISALYWSRQYDTLRDEHHACIVIDCCARCGDVATAEDIVAKLGSSKQSASKQSAPDASHINIETQTALLKVYVHAGMMEQASSLFRRISNPNVRTLNTLLRGCLWSAATPSNGMDTVVGGVATSEHAWTLYQSAFHHATHQSALDVSSYEYSIVLLCQALRVRDAEARTEQFCAAHQIRVKGKASITGCSDQSALETLAVIYLALARAYALLDETDHVWRACQRSLSALKASRALLTDQPPAPDAVSDARPKEVGNTAKQKLGGASGGKRGWKQSTEPSHHARSDRSVSNTTFRTHRLSELETDVLALLKHNRTAVTVSRSAMALRIRNRLLVFTGGAASTERTTNVGTAKGQARGPARHDAVPLMPDHLVSSWHSFGLSQLTGDEQFNELTAFTINEQCELPQTTVVHQDGTINFNEVFPDSKRPLDIEIGAGFGSWIVQQAQDNKQRNYVAVELRADRCFQIFSRATIEVSRPLDNVCVVGSECCGFLRDRIQPSSVSTVYANFPEPPTQTYGDIPRILTQIADGQMKEPSHMLHSSTMVAMGKTLVKKGRIIIVSDNRSYARLLAATLVKVVRENKTLLRSIPPSELSDESSLRHLEAFANVVDVYTQNDNGAGTSYFDRLWRTGAGRRSEKSTRFVILMKRL